MGIKTWSAADEQMMGSLWRAGYTGRDIADYFGTTRNATLGKLFRLGLLGHVNRAEHSRRTTAGLKRAYAEGRGNRKHSASSKEKMSIARRRWWREARAP